MYKLPNLMNYKIYSLLFLDHNQYRILKKNFKHKLENKLPLILIPYIKYLNLIKDINIHTQLLLEF
jgi:hypothetical protein